MYLSKKHVVIHFLIAVRIFAIIVTFMIWFLGFLCGRYGVYDLCFRARSPVLTLDLGLSMRGGLQFLPKP